jgi:uncharacterized glyoxalase superfamily protein PhnB
MTDAQTWDPPATAKVLSGVVAYLMIDGAAKAAQFYAKAFGAEEAAHVPEDEKGRTMHVHLHINGASVMLSDPFPEHGCPAEKPAGFSLHMQVEEIEDRWKRAVDAGCTVILELQDMFWGDRYGQLKDPFGITWSMGQTIKK